MVLNQNGFTLVEVLVSLTIGMVLIGICYSWIILMDQISLEEDILMDALQYMNRDILAWRNHQEVDTKSIEIAGVKIERNVWIYSTSPYRERALISYSWNVNGKPYLIEWDLERFISTSK